MKAVCQKHHVAHEVAEGCPWCEPASDTQDDLSPIGVLDVYLPHPKHAVKGFKEVKRFKSKIPIMLHLQESNSMMASVKRWDGAALSCAAYRASGTSQERSFLIDAHNGTWVAAYLGRDGVIWNAHIVVQANQNEWEFSISEFV